MTEKELIVIISKVISSSIYKLYQCELCQDEITSFPWDWENLGEEL